MSEVNAGLEGGVAMLLDRLGAGEPAITSNNPNGDGELLVVRKGTATYEIVENPGRKVRVRRHAFDDLATFAEFLNRHAPDHHGTDILVGKAAVSADFAPAARESSCVALALDVTPELARWDEVFGAGRAMGHKSLLRFLRQHAGEIESGAAVIAGLQSFSVSVTRGGTIEVDELGTVRAHSTTGKVNTVGTVPSTLAISPQVFECIAHRAAIAVLVEMEIGDDEKPYFTLICEGGGVERAKRVAREVVAAGLRVCLEDGFLVGIGSTRTELAPEAWSGDPREVPAG